MLALTPGGSMDMPGHAVRAGKLNQPAMNRMGGMKQMDHGDMNPEIGYAQHVRMNSAPAEEHEGHVRSGMAHEPMAMNTGKASPAKPAGREGTWLGILASDLSSKSSLASDGMSPDCSWPPYNKLRPLESTSFDSKKSVRDIRLTLDGDIGRYVLFLNNQLLGPSDDIEIKLGEDLQFIMFNRTMMHPPMHLHGQFFRVINAQGEDSPLKHTVDVAPMTTVVVEFSADEFGDWCFHCHLLHHMMSGMARAVHYQDISPHRAAAAVRPKVYHWPLRAYGRIDAFSHMADGVLVRANTRHFVPTVWQAGWQRVDEMNWEVAPAYDYCLNRFTSVFAEVHLAGVGDEFERPEGILGLRYMLPLNVTSRVWVDTTGEFQFAVSERLGLTPRPALFSGAEYDTMEHWEVRAGKSHLFAKHFSLTGQWHPQFGWGGGVRWVV